MPWSWTWHPHPDAWAFAGLVLGAYLIALRRLGPRYAPPGERPATRAQVRNFVLGVAAALVAAEYPVHDLAEGYLYSVHMVQHLLLTLVAPPLLMLGTPGWLARRIVPARAMRSLRRLTRPLVALIVFNAAIVFTHWPLVVEATVRSEFAHFGAHALLFASALVMWTPVCGPLLELGRLSYPGQMLYLFLQSLVPTVPASFLTFGTRPLYGIYETFPRVAGISALTDQRTAGLIMKIVGGAILWVVIAALFFRWYALEKEDGVDALEWHEVDRTLNRMELGK